MRIEELDEGRWTRWSRRLPFLPTCTWEDSVRWATQIVTPGPAISRAKGRAAVAMLGRTENTLGEQVEELTGLNRELLAEVEVVALDRPKWIVALSHTLRHLINPRPVSSSRPLRSPVRAGAMSALFTAAANRVYGHYDPTVKNGVIYIVTPNVVAAERGDGLDSMDFRRWVVLRTALYAAQFKAAPWLVSYIRTHASLVATKAGAEDLTAVSLPGLLRALRAVDLSEKDDLGALISAAGYDPTLSDPAWAAPANTTASLRRHPRGYTLRPPVKTDENQGANDTQTTEAGQNTTSSIEAQNNGIPNYPAASLATAGNPSVTDASLDESLRQLTILAGILDAYMRVSLEAITPTMFPAIQRIRHATSATPSPIDLVMRAFASALQLPTVRFSSFEARRFIRTIRAEAGLVAPNLMFKCPQNLPTAAELADPHLWLVRLGLQKPTDQTGKPPSAQQTRGVK
ncbi:hypothetical protein BK816_07665 [Boudabousia tangfeifanii]|uniref:Uncharacterized protein n=1 Tax=Boudabousia tangfeifanii TaxID=1912795 RepID=A0A1D9MLL8_9ACTO|nr:zinc-dependent metalloprotease [Boudabousia tangfeifanii]AOZ73186.1 hypothetical protein BK816_07665 [Boudabousia tangfeifanii]